MIIQIILVLTVSENINDETEISINICDDEYDELNPCKKISKKDKFQNQLNAKFSQYKKSSEQQYIIHYSNIKPLTDTFENYYQYWKTLLEEFSKFLSSYGVDYKSQKVIDEIKEVPELRDNILSMGWEDYWYLC
jgi:hypothetical protein